jgi:hypothetical protein
MEQFGHYIPTKMRKYCKFIHPTLIQLLTLSPTDWRTSPIPQRPYFVQTQCYDLFQQQSEIGWHHVMHGRLSQLWYTVQNEINAKTPTTWISFAKRQLLLHTHDNWITRCDTNHGTSKEDKRRRALLLLTPKIQQLYNKQSQIAPSDKYIFKTPIEEILQLPSHTLERWLHTAKHRITASIKRQRIMTRLNIQPIQKFFQRIVPSNIPRIKPHLNRKPVQNRRPINPSELQTQDNQTSQASLRYKTKSITNYFCTTAQHSNNDPFIPIPHNDYRPP